MVTYMLRFLNTQVSRKNGETEIIVEGKKHSLRLFDCCLVNLDPVFCLAVPVIHCHFQQQLEKFSITEYRKIDPNLTNSQFGKQSRFTFISHLYESCCKTTCSGFVYWPIICKLESYSQNPFLSHHL